MRTQLRLVLRWLLVAAAAAPLSFATTLLLLPVWREIERRWGMESVGHSGPADWCFELVFVAWFGVLLALPRFLRPSAPGGPGARADWPDRDRAGLDRRAKHR
jgi:hypothetical protein